MRLNKSLPPPSEGPIFSPYQIIEDGINEAKGGGNEARGGLRRPFTSLINRRLGGERGGVSCSIAYKSWSFTPPLPLDIKYESNPPKKPLAVRQQRLRGLKA